MEFNGTLMEPNGSPMDKIDENRQGMMFFYWNLMESYGKLMEPNGILMEPSVMSTIEGILT